MKNKVKTIKKLRLNKELLVNLNQSSKIIGGGSGCCSNSPGHSKASCHLLA